ncbi:hypothetical protein F5Y18DRAFT_436892 [Xylariaceae sp. FL1019]|nr:hypothetical protein F5Y18DRAFT_436892 [Xylariaceae sp. FL1019]
MLDDLWPPQYEFIYSMPALAPPPGVVPNYDNPPNGNTLSIAVLAVGTTLASLGYVTAVYAMSAMIYYTGFLIHQWNLHVREVIPFAHRVIIFITGYGITMFFAKTAILLEWMRIFVPDHTRNYFFYICCFLIALNLGVYTAGTIATNFACLPREKLWHRWVEGHCIDRHRLDTNSASFNLAIDLFILLLPQRIIWTLQMTKKKKIGVSIIFSVGLLAVVSAAGRTYATVTLDYEGDVTYGVSVNLLRGFAELTTVLIVFCITAVPKAIGESRMITNIIHSIRSWTRLSHTEDERSAKSLPRSDGSKEQRRKAKSGDFELDIMGNDIEAQRILRVTEIKTDDKPASLSSVSRATYKLQHPWIDSAHGTSTSARQP